MSFCLYVVSILESIAIACMRSVRLLKGNARFRAADNHDGTLSADEFRRARTVFKSREV
jgi:hypothetical protein